MHRPVPPFLKTARHRRTFACAALAALMLLAGCSSSGSLFNRNDRNGGATGAARTSSNESSSVDTGGLDVYLQTMQRLISGDSLTQAETFNELEDAAEFAPTTTNRLLYALALSLPGHPGSDPAAGAERLRTLIAAGDTLLPEERMLAQILLQAANRLEVLQAANAASEQRLTDAVAAREGELNAEHSAELAAAREENEKLKQELKNTAETLDAITNIERSISEREEP